MKLQVTLTIDSYEVMLTIVENAYQGGHLYNLTERSSRRALLGRIREYLAEDGVPLRSELVVPADASPEAKTIADRLWQPTG